MIKLLQNFLAILIGFSIAYINWEEFLTNLIPRFQDIKNVGTLVVCLLLTLTSYFILIYIPGKMVVASIEKREKLC